MTEEQGQVKGICKYDVVYWKHLLKTDIQKESERFDIEEVRKAGAYRDIALLLDEILSEDQKKDLFTQNDYVLEGKK